MATDDNVKRRLRFSCWITKATGTHSEYVILNACVLIHPASSSFISLFPYSSSEHWPECVLILSGQ
jgi:hypothetical protein